MPHAKISGLGTVILFLASIAGLILALYSYFTPLTGVTHTAGALLAIVVSALIAIITIVLAAVTSRGAEVASRVLLFLLLAGNCFAGLLLHEWWLCIAMLVGLFGLAITTVGPARLVGGAQL